MSLINEALKRPRDSAYQPVHTAPPAAQDRPVQSDVESSGFRTTLLVTVLIAALAVTGIGVLAPWLAAHIQSVQNAFAPSSDSTITETKRTVHATTHPAPMLEPPRTMEVVSAPVSISS